MPLFRFTRIAAVCALLSGSNLCLADTPEEHDEEGARLYLQKQYEPALREFRAAYRVNPKPRYLFNIGQCYRRLGLGPEAAEFFHRYLAEERAPDPTIQAELYIYIEQIEAAQDKQDKRGTRREQPEPPPRLVADEVVDLEELGDQVVRDEKSGSTAGAMELLGQIKQVWIQRHDPTVFYYVARTYERMGKRGEALEYYRRYLGTEQVDSPLRRQAALQLVLLTPTPPGQKYLWPALALGIVGIAGIATGLGLYFESSKTYDQYLQPVGETDKRALRDRGQPLALGSTISYAIGGGLLGTASIFAFVALGKGVRKKPPALIRVPTPGPGAAGSALQGLLNHPVRFQFAFLPGPLSGPGMRPGGGAISLQGVF